MARGVPNLDPRSAAELSGHLTDIVTKLEGLKAYENMGFFKQALPQLEVMSSSMRKQVEFANKLGRFWKDGAENLKKVAKAHQDVKKELRTQLELTKQIEKQLKAAKAANDPDAIAEYTEALKENAEAIKQLRDWEKKLNTEYTAGKVLKKSARMELAKMTDAAFNLAGRTGFKVAEVALTSFNKALTAGYDINERFRKTFAGMAREIGVFTPQLKDMQDAAKGLYLDKGGLGELGMSFEEIAAQTTGFATNLEYLDNTFAKDTKTLLTWGTALGLSGDEVGKVSKSMLNMGQNAGDLEELMRTLSVDAKKLGVNSKQLAKEVFVLGKNLLDMAGPRFQRTMIDAIETFKRFGLSSEYLEKFTGLTDNFDQSTQAMAKLNTMFGTHISSLQLLAEEDPAKRFEMITEQLRAQGVEFKNLDRNTKRAAASAMQMSMEELNAMMERTKGAKDYGVELQKMRAEQQKNEDVNQAMTRGLQELKNTLVPIAQIMDKVLLKTMKMLTPLFKSFGIEANDVGSSLQGISLIAERVGKALDKGLNHLGDAQFQQRIQDLGKKFSTIIDKFLTFLESPKFGDFLLKVMNGFAGFLETAGKAAEFLADHMDTISGIMGFLVEHAKILIGVWAGWKIGNAVMEMGKLAMAAKDVFGWVTKAAAARMGGGGAGTQMTLPGMGGAAAGGSGIMGALGAPVGSAAAGGALGAGAAALGAGVGGFMIGDWLNENVLSKFGSATASSMGGWGKMASLQWQFLKDAFRAEGGPVAADRPYIVGEKGPEVMVPSTAGTVVPNGAMGGPTIIQVILDGEVIQEKFVKQQLRSYT